MTSRGLNAPRRRSVTIKTEHMRRPHDRRDRTVEPGLATPPAGASGKRDTGNDPLGLDAARVLAAFVLVSVALAVTGSGSPARAARSN